MLLDLAIRSPRTNAEHVNGRRQALERNFDSRLVAGSRRHGQRDERLAFLIQQLGDELRRRSRAVRHPIPRAADPFYEASGAWRTARRWATREGLRSRNADRARKPASPVPADLTDRGDADVRRPAIEDLTPGVVAGESQEILAGPENKSRLRWCRWGPAQTDRL